MSKVLIIEDDINAQRILSVLMERNGYKYVAVYDAEDCLKQLAEDDFSLIVTDMNLPDMDGITLMKEIRKIKEEIPIIAISAGKQFDRGDKSQLDQARDLGASHIFQKPFEHEEFLKAVAQELKESDNQSTPSISATSG